MTTNPNAGEWNNTAPQAAGEPLALSGEVTSGGTESGGNSVNGLMDDAGIWNVTLSQTQVQAMYNTEMVPGLQATDLYGQGTMAKLFSFYSAETGSVKVGNLTWKYATGLSGGAGNAWQSNGVYYVQLGSDGTGLDTASAPIPGDANGDGRVDVNDLTVVLTNFGQTGRTWFQGCMDGDPTGTVDINDLTIVLANFGKTSGAGLAVVPEPSTFVLASVSCHDPVHAFKAIFTRNCSGMFCSPHLPKSRPVQPGYRRAEPHFHAGRKRAGV